MAVGLNIGSMFLDVIQRLISIFIADRFKKQENIFSCVPVKQDVYSIVIKNLKELVSSHYWLKDDSREAFAQECGRSR